MSLTRINLQYHLNMAGANSTSCPPAACASCVLPDCQMPCDNSRSTHLLSNCCYLHSNHYINHHC
jgi:hypothetical protein